MIRKLSTLVRLVATATGSICSYASAGDSSASLPDPRSNVEAACAYAATIPPDKVHDYTIRSGVLDIDGNGSFETIQGIPAMGTMRGDAFEVRDDAGRIMEWPEADLDGGSDLLFGARWLPFRGRAYLLGFEDERAGFLVRLSYPDLEHNLRIGCQFETKVEELFLPNVNGYADICEAVAKGEAVEIKPVPLPDETRLGRWTWSRGTVDVDLGHDGRTTPLRWLGYSSSAGRGCDANFFDTITALEQGIEDPVHLRLREAQRLSVDLAEKEYQPEECGSLERRWVKVQGKTYLETRYPGDAPHGDSQMVHRLQAIGNGRPETVCDALFSRTWSVVPSDPR